MKTDVDLQEAHNEAVEELTRIIYAVSCGRRLADNNVDFKGLHEAAEKAANFYYK